MNAFINFILDYKKELLIAVIILVVGLFSMIAYKKVNTEIKIQHDRFHKIQNN